MDPHKDSNWHFTKEQRPLNEANIVFSTNGLEQLDIHVQKRQKNNLDIFISFTKIKSEWIIDLTVKHENIKLL